MTIPLSAFRDAGLEPGDVLKVDAEGTGRVVLTRFDELLGKYSGCLQTGGDLRTEAKGLREGWR